MKTFDAYPAPLIVHSHLGWDWVWQRPQQFISRLARRRRVLFVDALRVVEKSVAPRYEISVVPGHPNVTLLQMEFPASRWGDGAWVDAQRLRLLREALHGALRGRFDAPIQWFYDPMAAPIFLHRMGEVANVYDCMDELSNFKFAPPELARREAELLQRADLVFAGGSKLWRSKKRFNANCHFYGCGVDIAHFSQARAASTRVPHDLPRGEKTLGFFGVVDERLDYELIEKLADAQPSWNVAMIGPTAKIVAEDLPQRANLHWLGAREYSQLPAYAKSFDVCLMPFARNAATEYINPTKALEYMATGTPIVSTDVPDVVTQFSKIAKIATGHANFIAACRAALEPGASTRIAVARGLRLAQANTWDAIVAKMEAHLDDVLASKQNAALPPRAKNTPAFRVKTRDETLCAEPSL